MNSLQIIFNAKVNRDPHYRVLVSLVRSDRPRHWIFKCLNCGSHIAKLQNYEVEGLTDFYDAMNLNNHAIGRHCKGTLDNGLPCPYDYYFHLT